MQALSVAAAYQKRKPMENISSTKGVIVRTQMYYNAKNTVTRMLIVRVMLIKVKVVVRSPPYQIAHPSVGRQPLGMLGQ